jgi:hypothetical protein
MKAVSTSGLRATVASIAEVLGVNLYASSFIRKLNGLVLATPFAFPIKKPDLTSCLSSHSSAMADQAGSAEWFLPEP